MKKLSVFDKIIFLLNSIFSIALLFSYVLPFVPPKTFPFLSLLSLGMPLLILVNFLFLMYWLLRLKRQFLLPLLVLLLGIHHVFSLFGFSPETSKKQGDEVSIMSYNVHLFNKFKWIEKDSVPEKIKHFIQEQSPDILCVQDYFNSNSISIDVFPYSFIHTKGKNSTSGQAIFSNFPIVNKGSLDFPDTFNNAVFADIALKNDTVRVFNVHLESLKIIPEKVLKEEVGQKLISRVGGSFVKQQKQMQRLLKAVENSPYPNIICADMNNSAFSFVYRQLEENGFRDAFKEAGNGFGKTYDFEFIPLRIDMIFVEDSMQVNAFRAFEVKLSDHYPILADVQL